MEAAITVQLAGAGSNGWKVNKLRKKVFAALGETSLTWTDYKDALTKIIATGTVIEAGDVVRLAACGASASAPSGDVPVMKQKKEKRKREETPEEDAQRAAKREANDAKREAIAKRASEAGDMCATLDVPAAFVPFLLRQQSTKLKNIETNSKTSIQIQRRSEVAEGCTVRTLTIYGSTEKQLNTAKVLLNGMLKSFHRHANGGDTTAANDGERPAKGKGAKGKGSGRGRGGKSAKGKVAAKSAGVSYQWQTLELMGIPSGEV